MKHYATLLLLITATFLHTHANAFAQGITLKVKDESLENVFKLIQKQSNYSFVYSGDQLKGASKVSLSVVNESIRTVLDIIMKEQPFRYEISEGFVIIKKKQSATQVGIDADTTSGRPIDLIGKVVDQDGKPVAGATVTVKASGVSTATGVDGSFIIRAEEKGMLVVTNVGYETKFVRVTKENITVTLNIIAQQMKEVVVSTGYQKVSAEKFVGSYSQLDSLAYSRRTGMGILERLEGTVNGVIFNKKGALNSIQIRGISSLGAGDEYSSLLEPLIVVDNFPMDHRFTLNNINPNDVENITVLKDAAATSIWGARAGNGVIVVTTKKGKFNKRMQLSISSNVTIINKPDLHYISRINTHDFIEIEKDLFAKGFYDSRIEDIYSWPVLSPVVEVLLKYRNQEITEKVANDQINALRNIDIRNELNKYVYRPAIMQQHYLNVNGGTNALSYNFSFGFNANSPNIKKMKGDQQYTLNSAVNFRPIKDLEIQVNILYGQNRSKNSTIAIPSNFPYTRLIDDNGDSRYIPFGIRTAYLDTISEKGLLDWRYRPLDEVKLAHRRSFTRFSNVNLSISYKITNWVTAALSYQYTNQVSTNENRNSINSYATRDLINRFYNPDPSIDPLLNHPVPLGDILRTSLSESTGKNGRASLNINKSIGIHQITAFMGAEFSETKGHFEDNQYYGYNERNGSYRTNIDFFNYYPQTFGAYVGNLALIPNVQSYSDQPFNRFVSLFGNASYTLNERYTLYGSARRDGANVFGVKTNNKWKPLWSIGAKWQVSNESFFDIDWVQFLSLRTSYGFSGNVNNTSSGKLTIVYSPTQAPLTNLPYGLPISANNPNLKWEKVGQLNFGLDFSVLKGRLSGSVDVFRKNSYDVIANYPFDPTTGTTLNPINSAKLKGNGFEINLTSRNLGGKFNWTTGIGLSYSKTIVSKIYKGGYKASDFISYRLNASEGKLAYAMSSYKWAGLDSLTGDPQGILAGKVSKNYVDILNDSVQNQVYHGSSIPLYIANVINSFRIKNFTFSFTIIGRFDYYFRKPAINIFHIGEFGGTNYTTDYYMRWQKKGDEKITNIPSITYPISSDLSLRDDFYKGAEVNVSRADNIRLQDVRIQYDWVKRGKSSLPFNSIQFFFYPNNLNLIIWRVNKSSFDPEYSGGSDPSATPPPKTWTIGVNINL